MKVLLAKLLLEKPDILLLDEPTNYLDAEHIAWLKRYLQEYENAFILISTRPAVEAGEKLGFLPGDLQNKVDPYLRPLYDALYEMLPAEQVDKKLAIGEIEIAPLAFMRGRTLSNAFVILDEAQNTTPMQMKMFLTRLGENSRMVVNGDLSQVDLPRGVISGLKDALDTLNHVSNISSVTFSASDVVRHGLVAKIVKAYEEKAKKQHGDD